MKSEDDVDEKLDAAGHALYRSAVGLAQHLSIFRADILYTLKQLGRFLESPTVGMLKAAKHLGRYLAGTKDYSVVMFSPRLQDMKFSPRLSDMREPIKLNVITDANWAACRRTRKSTHCVHISLGHACPLLTRCATQGCIALSSGEAEWYGGVAGSADALLMKSVMEWLGWRLRINLYMDSSAARGMAAKIGIGKMRTVEIRTLWLQEKVRKKALAVFRVRGEQNVADIGTTGLSAERLALLSMHVGLVSCGPGMRPPDRRLLDCLESHNGAMPRQEWGQASKGLR